MARRALGPATLAVVQAVAGALTPADEVLLVACSGGADSLALAGAAQQVGRRQGIRVAASVVDHGLQATSAEVAQRTRQQLHELGIGDVVVLRVAVDVSDGGGPEAAARAARYAALEAASEPRGATVLLGHTLNDQAETVLLGLARGSGTRSLAGMAVRTGRFLRPMLALPRATSEQACSELGLRPWLDPHNADPRYARSRVRQRVLPLLADELGPGIVAALGRTAQLARDDADLLDDLAAKAHPITGSLDCARLSEFPAALRSRVIRRWLAAQGAGSATYEHVRLVEELLICWHGQRGVDLAGVHVSRQGGQLICGPGGY